MRVTVGCNLEVFGFIQSSQVLYLQLGTRLRFNLRNFITHRSFLTALVRSFICGSKFAFLLKQKECIIPPSLVSLNTQADIFIFSLRIALP
jgi:hypothetical protein